jgi:predicted MFS family arabinose efflux permease
MQRGRINHLYANCRHAGGPVGSRRMVQVASTYFAGALLGPVLSANAWQLTASLFFFGATAGSMNASMNEQAILVESAFQKPLLSSFHACFSLGGMLGAFAGGLAADHGISLQQHLLTSAAILCLGVWITSQRLLVLPR